MKLSLSAAMLLCPFLASAQLVVTVLPLKISGSKAVLPLEMRNDFKAKVESARAVLFLLNSEGKVTAQSTKWVIGGSPSRDTAKGLAPGTTNSFYFVITTDKPFTTTNLTAKIQFTRVILENGKLADPRKDVQIQSAAKQGPRL